jgi:protein phosphatase
MFWSFEDDHPTKSLHDSAGAPMTTLRFGGRSDVGMQRQNNEDSMYAGGRLIAIADGVGGAVGGEVASSLTITALQPLDAGDITEPQSALQQAALDADAAIRDRVADDNALNGMSTTLTAILASDGALTLGHIGDSRAYRLRAGQLEQLTKDHTVVQTLLDEGQITEAEAVNHPRRSWIVRALDGRGHPELDLVPLDVQDGDRLLVCSDGLSDYVDRADIADGLAADDPQDAVEQLIDLALRAGAPDNVTCIVADPVTGDTSTQPPIVDGAVADGAAHPPVQTDDDALADGDADDATAPHGRARHAAPRRSIGKRLAVVACIVIALIAATVAGVAIYVHHQWYIAPSEGKVAVYQGVKGDAAGVHLSHVHTLTNIPVTALPQDDRSNVQGVIHPSGGESGANGVVANLRHDACTLVTPPPTPTPTKTGTPRPHASPSPIVVPTRPVWCVKP